jgi:hypothetical protein
MACLRRPPPSFEEYAESNQISNEYRFWVQANSIQRLRPKECSCETLRERVAAIYSTFLSVESENAIVLNKSMLRLIHPSSLWSYAAVSDHDERTFLFRGIFLDLATFPPFSHPVVVHIIYILDFYFRACFMQPFDCALFSFLASELDFSHVLLLRLWPSKYPH